GNSFAEFSRNLLEGVSGIRRLIEDDGPTLEGQIAGCLAELPTLEDVLAAPRNRMEHIALSCCARALRDAAWWDRREETRIGVTLGIGAEWLNAWQSSCLEGGRRLYDPELDQQSTLEWVIESLGLSGPAAVVAAACASGNYALAQGKRWIEMGWADVCLAGGCDEVSPMAAAGFGNLRALSRRTSDPAGASRPFDRERDGFVLGEGGAVLMLESADHARRRGARPYAELAGFGASSDASHMIIPSSNPEPAARAIRAALEDAQVEPEQIDYINAHATSTPVGDAAETRSLKLALGDAARRAAISSTKSMTGHLLSGAAALEAAACLAALERQAVPPTINLDDIDPACDLRHVPHAAQDQKVAVALSNSFGFGGNNTCTIFRKAA
ncbi:MAG: beta-ketoacyl-[acyl-carrier-protein] synthase family protein, partial [Planctomycetes bacterium]|nr:beta-ketoacyl-[acyl-carrier-protein] synthase family protein [Planctomycetota bacterium]